MRWRLMNLAAAASAVLCGVVAGCWAVGATQERQVRAWRLYGSPTWSCFVRLDRQHLILSDQWLERKAWSEGFEIDSTEFCAVRVKWLTHQRTLGTLAMPDTPLLNPDGAWFRTLRSPVGGVFVYDGPGDPVGRAGALRGGRGAVVGAVRRHGGVAGRVGGEATRNEAAWAAGAVRAVRVRPAGLGRGMPGVRGGAVTAEGPIEGNGSLRFQPWAINEAVLPLWQTAKPQMNTAQRRC